LLKKWLREPLLHFLFIGAVLFGISDQSKRIVFTSADINRLVLLWEKQRQRPPSQAELQGLIEKQIREQVLYREALAMGLDKNDSIVRRRLAQKVEFISSDLAAQIEPSDKDLTDYLASHRDKFEIPGRISFVQIYLSTDKRGAGVEQDASRLLLELKKVGADVDITKFGDSFMFGQVHNQFTEYNVARLFGQVFAEKLLTLPISVWQGPILSSYGLHLLRIDNKIEASQPDLATIRDKVRTEWMNQQRLIVDKAFYKSLRQRYEIVIEDVDIKSDVIDISLSTK